MERIKRLGRYQKALLLVMAAGLLVSAVLYGHTLSRVGMRYKDTILIPHTENGSRVYTGRLEGEQAAFTVSADGTVVFRYGEQTFAPYTVVEDASAIPQNSENAADMTGIEIRQGETVLFRGGALSFGDSGYLIDADGSLSNLDVVIRADGVDYDANGKVIDRVMPSAADIWELVSGPALTHRGDGEMWFMAALLCVLNTLSMLFAEELFRWNLSFRIRDAERAEPTDWELATRYIGWTGAALAALAVLAAGLL